jgi:sarcosine oxidase
VYIWDLGKGDNFYGFPLMNGPPNGVKVALHLMCDTKSTSTYCTPTTIDRKVDESEIDQIRTILKEHIPSLAGESVHTETCMYTVTPDGHFVIDFHPENRNVILASPCSGHGFKFCSVVGEIIRDLCIHGRTQHDISMFKIDADRLNNPHY